MSGRRTAGFRPAASESPDGNPALVEEIKSRIEARGPLTFAEFMDIALFHPGQGYYTRGADVIGPRGDYYTSPHVHPIFGRLIADQLHEMWQVMGDPGRFQIVEFGAGKGVVCYDVLSHLRHCHPDLYEAVSYVVVEAGSPPETGIDESGGEGMGAKVSLCSAPEVGRDLVEVEGCVLSNELVDALPFHLITRAEGSLKEVYVGLEDGAFVEIAGEPSSDGIWSYVRAYGIPQVDGLFAEVGLRAMEWMKTVAGRLKRGFAVTIDYGGLAGDLYSPDRRHGTLMCYFQHTAVDNPYIRVGRQDITAHVNFSALMDAGEAAGLHTLGFTSQAEFLTGLGLGDYLPGLAAAGVGFATYRKERAAVAELLRPDGLGGFGVLVQRKGVPASSLRGLGYRMNRTRSPRERQGRPCD